LDKIIPNFVESKNLLLCGAMVRLREKLGKVIESVIDVIKQKYYKVVKERLNLFDRELQDKFNEIQNLTKSFDDQKIKYKEKLENTLTLIGRKAAENIAILEERIKNLLFIQSLNPKTTFKNAMTYNFILSFTVFLMGGCAGYSNSFIGEPGKMNDLITVILVSGLKWGIIAFFVGLIISIVAAGLAFIEGVNQKQRLVQTINAIKEERDYEIDYYKKDLERNLKDSEDRFNKAIEEQKKHINDLKSEREKQEKVFKEEAEQRIHEEAKHLRALLES
jgi:predicted S18 family serine protease